MPQALVRGALPVDTDMLCKCPHKSVVNWCLICGPAFLRALGEMCWLKVLEARHADNR